MLEHKVATSVGLIAIKAKKQLMALHKARDKKVKELDILHAKDAAHEKASKQLEEQRQVTLESLARSVALTLILSSTRI